MKQHNFDDWVKDEISSFEQAKKPEWNKTEVYIFVFKIKDSYNFVSL